MTKSDDNLKAYWEKHFSKTADSPVLWEQSALQLEYAAEEFYAKELINCKFIFSYKLILPPSLFGVALMLYGLAIENFAKTIIIASEKSQLNHNKKFDRGFTTHKLVVLLERAKLTLTAEEKVFLNKLSEFITWQGKYPVPSLASGVSPVNHPDGSMSGNDVKNARLIVKRLVEKLPKPSIRVDVGLQAFKSVQSGSTLVSDKEISPRTGRPVEPDI